MSDDVLKSLYDRRGRIWEAMKATIDEAEKRDEGEKWTAEDQSAYDKQHDELRSVDERIDAIVKNEERQKKLDEERAQYESAARPSEDRGNSNVQEIDRVLDWFKRTAKGDEWVPKQVEFKVTDADKRAAWESRTHSKLTAAAGGNTVPTDFRRVLYEHLIENSAIRAAGATVITTDSGESIQLPKTTAHGGASLVAEAGTIPASDATLGQITLDAYKYGKLTQVSSELVSDSAVNLLDYLARDTGRAIGNASGAHFITGTGSGQPNGIITAATQTVTGPTGTATTLGTQGTAGQGGDALFNLIYAVTEPYRRNGKFLLRDASVKNVRTLKEGGTNNYIFQPGLQVGQPDTLLGYPIFTDPNVPAMAAGARSILFGDISAYYIRDVAGLRYERSDDFAFNQDLVTYRGLLRTDGDLVDTAAVAVWINSAT